MPHHFPRGLCWNTGYHDLSSSGNMQASAVAALGSAFLTCTWRGWLQWPPIRAQGKGPWDPLVVAVAI